jgi:pimeloyl-ACP methyl ester carboxylesterase
MSIDTTSVAPLLLDAPAVVVSEHTLTFDGFRYVARVARQGAGVTAPLVILGGSSQDRFSWARHETALLPLCDVVTVDLPGYGDADPLPERYGMDFLAATTRHMVDSLGLGEINLFGGCFGGAIALRFAQHYPDAVERLVLVGMTTVVPSEYEQAASRWLGMLDDGEHAAMAEELVARFMSPPGVGTIRRHAAIGRLIHSQFMAQTPRQFQMAVADHNRRLMRHEWYRPEPVPPVPALVFTGEHDSLTPPALGRRLAEILPGAAFTTVRDADHLVHMERIEEFTDLLGRFLTDCPIDALPYCNELEYPEPQFPADELRADEFPVQAAVDLPR